MYQDDPDWQLFSGMLKALYPESPLADDIAGTVDSIREITPEMLYENHHTFYHPANMTMLVVGKMDVDAMMATIRENQAAKTFDAAHPIDSVPFESGPSQAPVTLTAEVATPKLALGYRGGDKLPESGREKMRYKIANYVAVAMMFGPTSQWYQERYETGVIDDSFSFEFSLFNSFHFANFMAETDDPHGLAQEIKAHFQEYETAADLNDDHLALQMKEIIGDFYQRLNSVTYIASQFSTSLYDDVLYFDMLDVISDLTVDDLKAYVASFLANSQVSEVAMFPAED
jgi:predicted Zn-dependent peptidase